MEYRQTDALHRSPDGTLRRILHLEGEDFRLYYYDLRDFVPLEFCGHVYLKRAPASAGGVFERWRGGIHKDVLKPMGMDEDCNHITRAFGDALEPHLCAGDLVVIDSGREPDDGSLVLAVDGGQASFREWREGSDGYCWGVVALTRHPRLRSPCRQASP